MSTAAGGHSVSPLAGALLAFACLVAAGPCRATADDANARAARQRSAVADVLLDPVATVEELKKLLP